MYTFSYTKCFISHSSNLKFHKFPTYSVLLSGGKLFPDIVYYVDIYHITMSTFTMPETETDNL